MTKKILFISSTGGHFSELMQLKDLLKKYDYRIITEKTKSTLSLKKKYNKKIGYLVYGTKNNMVTYPFKFIYNCFKSIYYYIKFHPDYIITTGAHTSVPMCYIGKILGSRIIYIETFANINTKTMTGKLIHPIADKFIVQWPTMKKLYSKAIDGGWIY